MAHADDVARVAHARMQNNPTREDHSSFTLTDRAFIAKYRLSVEAPHEIFNIGTYLPRYVGRSR